MISRNYEVLVVDPSPGALIAATLLAKEGMQVLVLADSEEHASAGRFRFFRHRPPVVGFQNGLLLKKTLKALKFHPHELQAVRKGEPGLQVITPRHRFELSGEPTSLQAELEREFPRDAAALGSVFSRCRASAGSFADALDRACDEAGQPGFWQQMGLARPAWNPPLPPDGVATWGEFVGQAGLSDEATAVLRGLLRPFCSLDVPDDLPLPVAGIHLEALLDGAFADPSEEHPLMALLLRRVQAMRVDVLGERIEEFGISWKKIESVRFQGGGETPIDVVVTGGDPEHLVPLLGGAGKGYDKALSRLAPSHFRYSIFLGIGGEVVPPDLADHAVLITEDEGPTSSLLLSTTPPGSALAPEGCRAMTVSALVPYGEDGGAPAGLEAIASVMLDRVKWLVPWLERHVEQIVLPTAEHDADAPIGVDLRPAAYTPSLPPAEDPVGAGLGVALPHKNLFCAGPAAFPALGLGGEALAGRLVERLALAGRKR